MQTHQLLIEDAQTMNTEIVEEMNESTGATEKNYYIHGTFSTPDQKNRNGRVYSTKLWESAIAGWEKKVQADPKFRLGEWEHPSRVDPDPMKAVMKITSLKLEGGVVKGRAKILNDGSEVTNKIKALIDEGMKIGVSSRGTGRMKGQIVEEFNLSCYDCVASPSDYNAMLSGITESVEKTVKMNESTNKWECTDGKCSLPTQGMSDCQTKAKDLLESLKAFTEETAVLTMSEVIAKGLMEKKDPMDGVEIDKEEMNLKKAIDVAKENGMAYAEVRKREKALKQFQDYIQKTGRKIKG